MRNFVYIFVFLNLLTKAGTPSIIFKENKGQWPEKVLFGAEYYNVKFYVNKSSFNYCVYNPNDLARLGLKKSEEKHIIHGHNYEVNFVGANLQDYITANKQPENYNYFLGSDRSKWASKVKAFGNLQFNNIYKNIDLKLYSSELNLKYDFIVKQGGDVNSIRMNYNYVDGIELLNNEIIIKTSIGNVIEKEPVAWQFINGKKQIIKCKYVLLENNSVGFVFPDSYNKNYELIIDPVVVACSYSGSSVSSYNYAATYDSFGNIYNAAGADMGYPTTPGAFKSTSNISGDCVISAFNPTGTTKLFATYLGGDSSEYAIDINVTNDVISILGVTYSKNYPCSLTAFDSILGGAQDLFITKLDTSGSSLMASTLMGGSLKESFYQFSLAGYASLNGEMVLDKTGNVYVTSNTNSSDFPTTTGCILNFKQGPSDAVIFKLNSSLSTLVWSTYMGGSNIEEGSSIKLDGSGGVYCSGTTNSSNFPTTPGAVRTCKKWCCGNS
jgi:hypothetical protein